MLARHVAYGAGGGKSRFGLMAQSAAGDSGWRHDTAGSPLRAGPLARARDALEAERARWFLWVPVLMGAGIAGYFLLPVEPPLAVAGAALAAALAARLALPRTLALVLLLDVLLLLAFGFALAKLRAERVAAPVLERSIGPVEVSGYVELVEPRERRGQRLTIRVAALGDLPADRLPVRVRVRTTATATGLAPGDAIRVKAHLAPPAPPAMPSGYDFARQAWFMQLGGVGYAVGRPERDAGLPPPPASLAAATAVERLRQAIGRRVLAALDGQTAAIANALITGERGGIAEATNKAYRDSGLFHILSISGLHMAVMGGAVFYAVRLLLAAFPALALRFAIKRWAAAAAIVGSLAYLAISGASFATVRSFIMIAVMLVAIILERPALALRNVAIAALIILVLYPESLLDVGFQMSFAAVIALIAAYEAIRERGAERARRGFSPLARATLFLGGIVLSTLVASLAVAPLALFHFHKSQLLAVLANLLAIPVCNTIVMPAALATLVAMPLGLEGVPLAAMGFGVDLMTRVAEWVAAMPGAVVRHAAIPTSAFALMVAGGLWLALWSHRWRLLGLVLIALGAIISPLAARPDILIGRDGALVAIRGDDGRLVAIASAASDHELSRWLEQDGDAREASAVRSEPRGLSCDAAGCLARAKGMKVAVPRHPSALADDCAAADIVILDVPRPRGCTRPRRVVDFFDVRIAGTHALTVAADGRVHADTVAAGRGERPWSPPHPWAAMRAASDRPPGSASTSRDRSGASPAARVTRSGRQAPASGAAGEQATRVEAFAAPAGLSEHGLLRPEIEDEDAPESLPEEDAAPVGARAR